MSHDLATGVLPFGTATIDATAPTVRLYLPPRWFGDGRTVDHPLFGQCRVHGYGEEPFGGLVLVEVDAARWNAVRHLCVAPQAPEQDVLFSEIDVEDDDA